MGFQIVAEQKTPALGQSLGMGIYLPYLSIIGRFNGKKAMRDKHFGFTHDFQFSGREEVVHLGDRSFQGIFHRYHTKIEVAEFHPSEDIDKFHTGDIGARWCQFPGRDLSIGAVLPLKCDKGAVLLLKPFTLFDNGFQKLTGKRLFDQIQVHPFHPCQNRLFPLRVGDGFLELPGTERIPHPFL